MELYKKYRPTKLSEVIGQTDAVNVLKGMIREDKVAHCLLFSGPSGCGKTTLARIMQTRLNCGQRDYSEINAAEKGSRGIDMTHSINQRMRLSPLDGDCRIYYIDECHQLSKDAWTSLLKPTEDTPSHVYFFFATTEPGKVINTIKTRSTEVCVKLLQPPNMKVLLDSVLEKEEKTVTPDVKDRIIEVAAGSPRKALVLLHQVIDLSDETQQLAAIRSSDTQRVAFELCRMLLDSRVQWGDVAKFLQDLPEVDNDPEGLRHMVLTYAKKVLLGGRGQAPRAFITILHFGGHFYDSKSAGFVAACYEVVNSGKKK